MAVRSVRVYLHQEADGFWAESPDAPGFTAVGTNLGELRQRALDGIQFYFEDEKVPLLVVFMEADVQQVGNKQVPVVWAGAKIVGVEVQASSSLPHIARMDVHFEDFAAEQKGSTESNTEVKVKSEVKVVA